MEYRYASIRELRNTLSARNVSSQELVSEATGLLNSVGRRFNAVAAVLNERSQPEAKRADSLLQQRENGVLCGIPFGVKDIFAARGGPTTWGALEFAEQVFDYDAQVIADLTDHGSVLVAKLTMTELAGGGRSDKLGSSLHSQALNPWDPTRYAGGSSGGSGIAVALGLLPYALGSETAGSILGPAAFSGVTGLRPTFGTVSRKGVMALSRSLDKVGVLARSAADCALVLRHIQYEQSEFPSREARALLGLTHPNGQDLRGLRVAFSQKELTEVSSSMRGRLAAAIDDFRALGLQVIDLEVDRHTDFTTGIEELVRIEAAYEFLDHLRSPTFRLKNDHQLRMLRAGSEATAMEYLHLAWSITDAAVASLDAVFEEVDLILSPSRPYVAPLVDQPSPPRDSTKMSTLLGAAGNLAGIPGISFPCGLSTEGLPVGLQLLGPKGSEHLLFWIAHEYQRHTDHHLLRPPEIDVQETEAGTAGVEA